MKNFKTEPWETIGLVIGFAFFLTLAFFVNIAEWREKNRRKRGDDGQN
jgi:hypothetical protein